MKETIYNLFAQQGDMTWQQITMHILVTVFHQINTQTEEVSVLDPKKKKDPLSQAIDGAYHYRRVFEKITKANAHVR